MAINGSVAMGKTTWMSLVLSASLLTALTAISGCGSSGSTTAADRTANLAIEKKLAQLFVGLERGRYTTACETFTVRSRVSMALASAFDRRETDSSCSDVFVVATKVGNLGLNDVGDVLRANALKMGLGDVVDLPTKDIRKLYADIGSTTLSSVISRVVVEGDKGLYKGHVIAVRERGQWLLEAVRAKTTNSELGQLLDRQCTRHPTQRYSRLCTRIKPVLAGKVLSGPAHREVDRLLYLIVELPNFLSGHRVS